MNWRSPTLWVWCLVSRVLVSATFLKDPERFQPHWPLEPLEWWLSQVKVKEPRNEQGGMTPDGILGTLFQISGWPSPDWTHSRDRPTHQEWPRGQVKPWGQSPVRRSYPDKQKRLITSLELPGREHQIGRPGDSGKGRYCDTLWVTLYAWLLIEGSGSGLHSWRTMEPERIQNLQFCDDLKGLKGGASLWGPWSLLRDWFGLGIYTDLPVLSEGFPGGSDGTVSACSEGGILNLPQ